MTWNAGATNSTTTYWESYRISS